jgi:hypothetical protein
VGKAISPVESGDRKERSEIDEDEEESENEEEIEGETRGEGVGPRQKRGS